ncbi:hypothetical protein [Candidatus Poriferisodalis sp.]|uniref:hypothetical protein n=1 Tax=Candidatus Poriferisodalis sp. TaxID=3101277 RepID=UPI003B5A4807
MSADAEPTAPQQRRESRVMTVGPVLAGAVTVTLIQRFTEWPWWIVSGGGVVIAAAVVAFEWGKRRRKAETAAGGSSG